MTFVVAFFPRLKLSPFPFLLCSVQFSSSLVSMRSARPILCAPPRLSGVPPTHHPPPQCCRLETSSNVGLSHDDGPFSVVLPRKIVEERALPLFLLRLSPPAGDRWRASLWASGDVRGSVLPTPEAFTFLPLASDRTSGDVRGSFLPTPEAFTFLPLAPHRTSSDVRGSVLPTPEAFTFLPLASDRTSGDVRGSFLPTPEAFTFLPLAPHRTSSDVRGSVLPTR